MGLFDIDPVNMPDICLFRIISLIRISTFTIKFDLAMRLIPSTRCQSIPLIGFFRFE